MFRDLKVPKEIISHFLWKFLWKLFYYKIRLKVFRVPFDNYKSSMKKLFFEISLESCHEIPLEISILNSTLIIHYKVSLNFLKVPLENYYFKFHKSFNRKLNIKFPIRNFHPRNWFCKMKRWIWKKHSYSRSPKRFSRKFIVLLIGFLLFFLFCKIILLYHGYCFALLCITSRCIALHCIA